MFMQKAGKIDIGSSNRSAKSMSTSSTSAHPPRPSKLSTLAQKLNPFSKNETPEQKEVRIRDQKRKKELIEKYSTPPEGHDNDYLRGIAGTRGAKKGSVVLGAEAAGSGGGA